MKSYADIPADGGSDVLGQVAEQSARMHARLSSVRHIVAVMSGKGGVGKSTFATNLAEAFAMAGLAAGILDGDINGPSVGRIAGVHGTPLRRNGGGMIPAVTGGGVKVMSMDLLLEDESTPVMWDAPTQASAFAWRGLMEAGALRELISDTEWGELDFLVVDLPPGSDKLPNLADVLPRLSGAVVITIPSGVSKAIVGKSVRMARELLGTPLLGVVENMSGYVCPSCGRRDALYPSGSAATFDVPLLGQIPFDPVLASASDEGRSYVREHSTRPAARAIIEAAGHIQTILDP